MLSSPNTELIANVLQYQSFYRVTSAILPRNMGHFARQDGPYYAPSKAGLFFHIENCTLSKQS